MSAGVCNGYQDVEDPHVALRATPEDRPGRQTVKELIEAAGWKIRGVNWIYQQVTGDDLVRGKTKLVVRLSTLPGGVRGQTGASWCRPTSSH